MATHDSTPKNNQGKDAPKPKKVLTKTQKEKIKKLNKEVWQLLGFGLLLFALVGLYFYLRQSPKKLPITKKTKDSTSTQKKSIDRKKQLPEKDRPKPKPENRQDTLKPVLKKQSKRLPLPQPKQVLSEELLAYRNARVQELEDDIDAKTRSSDELVLVSPQLHKTYQKIVFEVEYAINERLYISVFDSTMAHQTLKDELPMQQQGTTYRLAMPQLKKGTYYWMLTNDDKKLYNGKFYIK
jgi:cytoskeletal protein RodZ